MRRTKIICTIGPASAGRVPELVEAGMDIARINFSNGSDEDHTNSFEEVRKASENVPAKLSDRDVAALTRSNGLGNEPLLSLRRDPRRRLVRSENDLFPSGLSDQVQALARTRPAVSP